LRGQVTFLSDDEISRLIAAVATTEPQYVKELVQLKANLPSGDGKALSDRDELYESAIDIVVREGRGSVSLLQRSLGIGYGRAARLIDFMAEDGIVGPYNGSQAREILMSPEQWEQLTGQGASAPPASTKPPRNNKILPAAEDVAEDEDSSLPGKIRAVKPVSNVRVDEKPEEEETLEVDEELENGFDEQDEEPPFDADETEEDEDEEDLEDEDVDDQEEEIEDEEEDIEEAEEEAEEEEESPSGMAKETKSKAAGKEMERKPAKPYSKGRWKAESA
jgi:S-DNA-T family DNA segregation ATPase FtsK/SpoIIIE